ncbi:hypothetical protein ACFY1C_29495 [Streptomyces sp. NPDC001279]
MTTEERCWNDFWEVVGRAAHRIWTEERAAQAVRQGESDAA